MKIFLTALSLTLSIACAGPVMAQVDSRVTEANVAGHADMALRAKSPTLYLTATGDLNGDGIEDEAAFYRDPGDQVRVGVTFGERERSPFRIVNMLPMRSLSLKNDIPRMGLEIVEHEFVVGACEKTPCKPIAVSKYGLRVFTFESAALLYTWDGKQFVETVLGD
ncbi:MAG: hypothetical protein LDL37_01155 [Asticcacaulis sp.]|uniref:hypothetical protein n=1 Tax=Asticcacaulis sp. TaxID=1872648 RepID=UPI0025BEEEE2|nr:hypothetical protein [Asticcacaulis sp.]MCA1934027.1 hypothetical protein [Asticcacaulis sp.]